MVQPARSKVAKSNVAKSGVTKSGVAKSNVAPSDLTKPNAAKPSVAKSEVANSDAYVLPEVMDLKAASALTQDIIGFQGRALTLDASRVERIGGLCLQVLLSARLTWKVERLPFSVVNSSPAFSGSLALFGVPHFAVSKTG